MKFKARLMHIFLISKNFNSDDFLFLLFSAGCLLSRCNVALGLAWLAGCMALNTYFGVLADRCLFFLLQAWLHSFSHTYSSGGRMPCLYPSKEGAASPTGADRWEPLGGRNSPTGAETGAWKWYRIFIIGRHLGCSLSASSSRVKNLSCTCRVSRSPLVEEEEKFTPF